jgi:hypothetical protein
MYSWQSTNDQSDTVIDVWIISMNLNARCT